MARTEVEDPTPPPPVTEAAPEDLPPPNQLTKTSSSGCGTSKGSPYISSSSSMYSPRPSAMGCPGATTQSLSVSSWRHLRSQVVPISFLKIFEKCPEWSTIKPIPPSTRSVHLLYRFVGDLVVGHVAPPEEHVRRVQYLIGEPVLGLVEGGRTDLEAGLVEHCGEDGVHAFGVDLRDLLVALFVPVLVPDGYARLFSQV